MTTIAIRNGILAVDGRVTRGSEIMTENYEKAIVIKRVGILAASGVCVDRDRFVDACRKGELRELKLADNTTLILARPDGRVSIINSSEGGTGIFTLKLPIGHFLAFGSGAEAASAAMHMGASARRAVEVAAKVDSGTNDNVSLFDVRLAKRL